MDSDIVRLSLILGPPDSPEHVLVPTPMPRWRARDAMRDFGFGETWEGRPVMRALIVG